MNRNEYTPDNFPERFEADGITVEYADLKEIQMGSPLIGRLSVNGVPLSGNFGGAASAFPIRNLCSTFSSQGA